MSHSHNQDEHFSEDLQKVADVLRDGRPTLDPLALDRVKLRAMSGARRSTSSTHKGSFMKSRVTALASVGFLMLGTGGTMALAGGDGGSSAGSASFHQYRPPCEHGQGRGGNHECHGHEGEHGGGGGQGGDDHGSGNGGGQGNDHGGGHDSGHGHH